MSKLFHMSAALFAAWIACAPDSAWAEQGIFNNPRWGGNRLDVCLTWGRDCGQPVADRFCQRKQYRRALSFETLRVGDSEPTQLLMSKTVCRGSFCTAMMSITCDEPFPREQIFVNPNIDGYRLDHCRVWANECGKPAADAFCSEMGYSRALHEFTDADPGYANTIVIGSRQVCRGSFCTGFQMIVCE